MSYIGWATALAMSFMIQGAATKVPADVAAGEKVFQRACALCHSLAPGKKMTGPSLAGVFGRPIGKQPGYAYSAALAQAKGTWDAKHLDQWLTDPKGVYTGTKMITRLPSAPDRVALIAYLKTRPIK